MMKTSNSMSSSSISRHLLLILAIFSSTATTIFAQQLSHFNASGVHLFRGALPRDFDSAGMVTTQAISFGRAFIAVFKDANCTRTTSCRNAAIAQTQQGSLDCTAHTFYNVLGMMGTVCFGPLSHDSNASDQSLLARLKALKIFKDVSMDAVAHLIEPVDFQQSPTPSTHRPLPPASSKIMPVPSDDNDSSNETTNQQKHTSVGTSPSTANTTMAIEALPYNWGRDRINQVSDYLDHDVRTCASGGANVLIYLLDTGCRASHSEFSYYTADGARVRRATTQSVVLSDGSLPYGGGVDGYGHGSHTAGIAAGRNVGIAPKATIRCIKVLSDDGSGMVSDIMAGMEMVARAKQNSPKQPMVVNLSLGSPRSSALNAAVDRLSSLGVAVCVASGNSNQDAYYTSPASANTAMTVSATDNYDGKESWSNYGSVVNIYAPGGNIYSSYNTGDSAYATMSGTSMAAPAVTGAIACVLGQAPSSSCSSTDSFVGKLKNPRVSVSQYGGSRPLVYMPTGSKAQCP